MQYESASFSDGPIKYQNTYVLIMGCALLVKPKEDMRMKKTWMKNAEAAVLALALLGGAVPAAYLTGLPLDDAAVVAVAYGEDLSWFDAETGTLHLSGAIENQVKSSTKSDGVMLPEGAEKEAILHVVVEEGAVSPENCLGLFGNIGNYERNVHHVFGGEQDLRVR